MKIPPIPSWKFATGVGFGQSIYAFLGSMDTLRKSALIYLVLHSSMYVLYILPLSTIFRY